jgi:hypothetical protein
MEYTQEFFSVPIRIYNGFDYRKEMEKEEALSVPADPPWVTGWAALHRSVFEQGKVYWYDGFSRARTIEEVENDGFDLTIISTVDYGDFVCTWQKRKFEKKLNEFMMSLRNLGV